MGIKHFFMWFKNHFSEYMRPMRRGDTLATVGVSIDNLMIDMNGVFHNSAQKIYQYGNFKPPSRLLGKNRKRRLRGLKAQLAVFEDVCKTVELLFSISKPRKRLILCVDGPAPISKQNQQRQRRFRSAIEATDDSPFDSNCITPGTKFMDYLSKYIDWYIRKRMSVSPDWRKVQVLFSNEKAPGEGEHKIVNYIRYYGKNDETYCINGLDADLIMLALGTHMPNFYILREDLYDQSNEYFCIDIGGARGALVEMLEWESSKHLYIPRSAVNDFIFLCFMVGNDFLPHIPSLEIIQNGIELIVEVYKEVCSAHGHITTIIGGGRVQFVLRPLAVFLGTIGHHEKENLQNKLRSRRSYFEDKLLDSCATQEERKWIVDIDKYKKDYWTKHFGEDDLVEEVCHKYLEGMQWVLSYYTRGVPNWKWHFAYHYAPPASVLAKYVPTFKFPCYSRTIPSTPFQQLLSVLPPQSSKLIPPPLCNYLTDDNSPLKDHCPTELEIDLSGKRREWEGIVILPMVEFEVVRECYFKSLSEVDPRESRRNVRGRSFLYEYDNTVSRIFKSFYGDINDCRVKTVHIDL
jgi:5'-3' exoribonuclease 1